MAGPHQVELDDNELKLLLVAIRQVQNTFAIAGSQGSAESLVEQYEPVQELYERLHRRLAALLGGSPQEKPFRIK